MLRKHRYCAVDEVDTRGTFLRLLVYYGTLFHVVRHIGYVHSHLPQAVVEPSDGQRVVEVLGVVRVDGAREDVAEVLALLQILLGYLARYLVGGVFHSLRIFVGQAILREDGVHLNVVVARRSEHINHFAEHAPVLAVGPLNDFHHGLVAVFSTLQLTARDYYASRQSAVLRYEICDVVVGAQLTHEFVLGSLYYLDYLRLLYVFLPARHYRHPNLVSRERPH